MKPSLNLTLMILGYLTVNLVLLMFYKFPVPLSGFYEKIDFSSVVLNWDELILGSFFYIIFGGWLYLLLFFLLIFFIQKKIKLANFSIFLISFLWGGIIFSSFIFINNRIIGNTMLKNNYHGFCLVIFSSVAAYIISNSYIERLGQPSDINKVVKLNSSIKIPQFK